MLERLGVQNEWRDKSKLAFAKLQRMLDPSFKFDFADPDLGRHPDPGPAASPDPGSPVRSTRRVRSGAVGPGSQADRPAADRPRTPDSLMS